MVKDNSENDKEHCKACTSYKSMTEFIKSKGSIQGVDQKKLKQASKLVSNPNRFDKGESNSSKNQVEEDNMDQLKLGKRTDCPADSEELGRHTWTFLHSTAAYYPKRPTEQQKSSILDLIGSLPVLYPCKICANDLEDQIKESPPRVQSREHLEQWFCEIHNQINRKLGKEEFNCKFVSKRWRDGWDDGSCD